jgi:hypothetical protein
MADTTAVGTELITIFNRKDAAAVAINAKKYAHTYIYMYVSIFIYTYIYMFVYIYVYLYICMYIYIKIYIYSGLTSALQSCCEVGGCTESTTPDRQAYDVAKKAANPHPHRLTLTLTDVATASTDLFTAARNLFGI